MGGSASQDVFLKDWENLTTHAPENMFEVSITCNVELVDGKPVIKFNPQLSDGERAFNPFVGMKKMLEEKERFACVSGVYLVSHHNDLNVPVRIEIHNLFSMSDGYKFKAFPKKEILSLGGVDTKQNTNNTGVIIIEIPKNCNKIFSTAIDLYESPLAVKALLAYGGSDNMFEEKNETMTNLNISEYVDQRGEDEKDDNNNNNNDDVDGLNNDDMLEVENDRLKLGFKAFSNEHIFIKALNQYGTDLKIPLDRCKRTEDGKLVMVPNYDCETIYNYMNRIFFRKRRYTTFNGTKLVNAPLNNQDKLIKSIQENIDKGWTPQISFTVWVDYIMVSNKDTKTKINVTKIK